ncbi:MAG: hypothetical protein ACYS21_14160, partial [Planctomycetota bacterium]
MRSYDNPTAGNIDVDAFRVKKDWFEGTQDRAVPPPANNESTYSHQYYNSTWWTSAGADDCEDRETIADDTQTISSNNTWYSWDVTDSVKYMFDTNQYDGWMLKAQSEGTAKYWRFFSSEHATASYRPYLEITYDSMPPSGVIYKGTVTAEDTGTSVTTGNIAGGTDMLFVVAVGNLWNGNVNSVTASGGGLTFTEQKEQCSPNNREGISVWTAYGSKTNFTVTATTGAWSDEIIAAVSWYSGVDPTTPIEDPTGWNSDGQDDTTCDGLSTSTPELTTNSTVANGVHYVAMAVEERDVISYDSSYEQRVDQRYPCSGVEYTRLWVGDYRKAATGSDTWTGTLGSAGSWATAGFVIRPEIPITATKLVFTVEPSNTAAESTFLPAIKVEAQDDLGVTDTNYTANISIAILNNPPGDGILSGTTTVAAVNGVATFSDLSIDKVGVGYTLQATSGSLTAATSVSFNITAIKLVFTAQPTGTPAEATISTITVAAQDNHGNTDTTFTGDISMAIGTNPPGDGILSGTTPVAAVSGVSTFSNLSIDKVGVGYTLQATATGLTAATSTSFNITAIKLVFTAQPSNTRAGATITPAIEVAAQDNYGNTDTTYTGNISMAIGTIPPGDGILSGTTPVAAISGVATFSDLSIDKAGAGYTLQATATGLTSGTSISFNITSATKLVLTVQPTNTKAEATIAAITVEAQDDLGTTDTIYDEDISIAILNNPPTDGILSGT